MLLTAVMPTGIATGIGIARTTEMVTGGAITTAIGSDSMLDSTRTTITLMATIPTATIHTATMAATTRTTTTMRSPATPRQINMRM
jgi:tRNA C32,U32 (ribose-2'-O)-methylase TrmJ